MNTKPTPPPRGSSKYTEAIKLVTVLENRGKVEIALSHLWDDYGWRGPMDTLVNWLWQLETHPNSTSIYRDMFGAFDLTKVIDFTPSPESAVRLTALHATDLNFADGRAPHEAFQAGREAVAAVTGYAAQWRPYLAEAARVAHVDRNLQLVLAALFPCPGRTDRDSLIHISMFAATAAMLIRNLQQIEERFNEVANSDEPINLHAVNPGWGGHFKFRDRPQ